MATQLSEIVDLFMTRIQDYRLNAIYTTSGSLTLNTYAEPWLLDSIVEFDVCDQALNYTTTGSATDGSFDIDLSMKNKSVLSQIMVKYWLTKQVSDLLSMSNLIQDHDFRQFSQSSNLKAKQDYLNQKREEISQLLVDYGYRVNNWTEWKKQNFDGSG